MIAFLFESAPSGGGRWGEVEEVSILASDEAQAWEMLKASRAPFEVERFILTEQKPIAPGVLFSTSYTIGF